MVKNFFLFMNLFLTLTGTRSIQSWYWSPGPKAGDSRPVFGRVRNVCARDTPSTRAARARALFLKNLSVTAPVEFSFFFILRAKRVRVQDF